MMCVARWRRVRAKKRLLTSGFPCSATLLQYDRIFQDILPFHALSPAKFRERVRQAQETDFTYTFRITSDPSRGIEATGGRADNARPRMLAGMIEGFRIALPRGFDVQITASDHDLGSWVLGQDQRDRAVELVGQGRCEWRAEGRGEGELLLM